MNDQKIATEFQRIKTRNTIRDTIVQLQKCLKCLNTELDHESQELKLQLIETCKEIVPHEPYDHFLLQREEKGEY